MFYPASPTVQGASIVTVVSGQDRSGVDLQVKPVPTARLSGILTGPAGPGATLPVRLIPAGSEDMARIFDAAGTVTDVNGAFTFLAVPSGDYTLRTTHVPRQLTPPGTMTTVSTGSGVTMATSSGPVEPPAIPNDPMLWATIPVSIADADVTGLTVALRTGLRIRGRIEFEGSIEKPPPDQLSRILVTIEPVDGQLDRAVTPPGRIDAGGQFNTYGYAAGRYFVRVGGAPSGWTFKGAFHGDRDVSDVPLELESTDISDVILTFTDRPASLAGTVQLPQRAPAGGIAVVVFPADSKSWMETGVNPRRMRKVATTDAGSYQVSTLPPGDYFVAAIAETAASDWQDPKFLEALAAGASQVQVGDGEKITQNLRLQEVR
jgi:hypothetical protein